MQPLVEELIPCPDPWDVARKLAHLPHLLFLDSSERHAERGRYSYVMADPNEILIRPAPANAHEDVFWDDRFDCIKLTRPTDIELPPFLGGWAGLIGYHLGRGFDRQPYPHSDSFHFADMAMGVYDCVFAFDHQKDSAWLISNGIQPEDEGWNNRPVWARERLNLFLDILKNRPQQWHADLLQRDYLLRFDSDPGGVATISPGSQRSGDPGSVSSVVFDHEGVADEPTATPSGSKTLHTSTGGIASLNPRLIAAIPPGSKTKDEPVVYSSFTRDEYVAAVRRVIDYIDAGDVFQVNLSQRLLTPLLEHPLELYGRLRQVSPAPFSCYFDCGDFQIISASPERFLKVTPSGEISTKPIKGTRPRGKTPAEDAALIGDLLTNPKDRAENVMIVDLLRNDIGKVAEYGSVTVSKVCELESYSYVHHLVSEVRGQLRKDKTPFDLLRAAFPGGSVTGAPKVRAMEIIAELEPTARGPYCGSIGFIGFDGAMDTNILIRTMTAGRGWLQFPVGGGIVADSDPEAEYQETLTKAQGMLRALSPLPG